MAAARVARKRQLGYALKRRIAALDPDRIAQHDALRATLHLEAPSKHLERLVRAGARASSPLLLVRPFRSDRSWLDLFGPHHVGAPDFERMGHRNEAGRFLS